MTMASQILPSSTEAPWRSMFLEHVGTMPSPEFMLSTVRRVPRHREVDAEAPAGGGKAAAASSSSSSPDQEYEYVPRVRTCIYRGMWADLPVNPRNTAELNPDLYSSELPTFTTDSRMDKMEELFMTWGDKNRTKKIGGLAGTGGGAPVEAIWWATEPMVQWRVRGRAYVLGPDVEDKDNKEVVDTLLKRMRPSARDSDKTKGDDKDEGKKVWSFAREVTAQFGNLSPGMRGSFRNPPPGQNIETALEDADNEKLGQKVGDVDDEVARRNFRVVVVVPEQVDRADLSDPSRGRRWIYTFKGQGKGDEGGEWEKIETWP